MLTRTVVLAIRDYCMKVNIFPDGAEIKAVIVKALCARTYRDLQAVRTCTALTLLRSIWFCAGHRPAQFAVLRWSQFCAFIVLRNSPLCAVRSSAQFTVSRSSQFTIPRTSLHS